MNRIVPAIANLEQRFQTSIFYPANCQQAAASHTMRPYFTHAGRERGMAVRGACRYRDFSDAPFHFWKKKSANRGASVIGAGLQYRFRWEILA
jgi:hypothetical protein